MPKGAFRNLGAILLVSLLVLGGVWLFVANNQSAEPAAGATPEVEADELTPIEPGEQAPIFTARTVDGKQFDLAEWAGKPVWMLFNASWCGNCRAEIPDVIEAAEQYDGEVNVVAIYMSQTDPEVKEYGDLLGVPYPQIADPENQIAFEYGVVGLPTSVFIAPDGTVEEVYEGGLSPYMIEQKLDALLGK